MATNAKANARTISLVTMRYLPSSSLTTCVCVNRHTKGRQRVHYEIQCCIQVLIDAIQCGVALIKVVPLSVYVDLNVTAASEASTR